MTYHIDFQSGGTETVPTIPGKTSIDLVNNVVDTTSTTLTLTGRGVPNYGEVQQENFIRLLENFASKNPPSHPTVGQIWFDSITGTLKVYGMDQAWHGVSASPTTATPPANPSTGDIWYEVSTNILYIWNGATFVPISTGGTSYGSNPPSTPAVGTLWYNPDIPALTVWDGTTFAPVASVAGGSTEPSPSLIGQLWYNTTEKVLYLRVDPAFSDPDYPRYHGGLWVQVWPSVTQYASYTEYNTLAQRVNRVIGAPVVYGSDTKPANNQYGWGQTDVLETFSDVNTPSQFDNSKWTILESRLRKALRHTTTAESTVPTIGFIRDGRGSSATATLYTPDISWVSGWQGNGIAGLASHWTDLQTAVTALETNRFTIDPTAAAEIVTAHTDQTVGATWASDRVLDVSFQFTSDTAAKEFFNSGSAIRFTVSLFSGSAVGYSWWELVTTNNLDTSGFVLDYYGNKIGLSGAYNGGAASLGFYDLTTSFQQLATYARGGAYGVGNLTISAMYDPATPVLVVRLAFIEDYTAGEFSNQLTVVTDVRKPVTTANSLPYIDTPAIATPTVVTSGTFLTAAAGT